MEFCCFLSNLNVWISRRYTYVPSLLTSLPSSSPSHSSSLIQIPCLSNVFKRHLREARELLGGGRPGSLPVFLCTAVHSSPFWPCSRLALSAWSPHAAQSGHLRLVKPSEQRAHLGPPACRGLVHSDAWSLSPKTSGFNCHTPCLFFS